MPVLYGSQSLAARTLGTGRRRGRHVKGPRPSSVYGTVPKIQPASRTFCCASHYQVLETARSRPERHPFIVTFSGDPLWMFFKWDSHTMRSIALGKLLRLYETSTVRFEPTNISLSTYRSRLSTQKHHHQDSQDELGPRKELPGPRAVLTLASASP